MADIKLINTGRQQSSYKEFQITLPAGGIYTLNNPFNYFRCLDASGAFKVAWSANQMDTDFEAGLGISFDDVIPYAQIFNPSAASITIRIGCGIGYFDDSRLTVSGNVYTRPAQFASFTATTVAISSGKADIPVAAQTVIQNNGSHIMYIGGTGTDGLRLEVGGTFEFSCAAVISVYGTNGDTIAIGSFN